MNGQKLCYFSVYVELLLSSPDSESKCATLSLVKLVSPYVILCLRILSLFFQISSILTVSCNSSANDDSDKNGHVC